MAVEVITVQLPGSPGSAGPKGDPGPSATLTIGTVTTTATGTSATATITGSSPNQVLNLSIPRGPQGAQGATPTLAAGTITTGTPGSDVVATLTGTAPNYALNLQIPRGQVGLTGPANTLTIGTVTTTAPGTSATATITGSAPSQTLSFTIPQGPAGIQGVKGDQGIPGIQGLKGDKGDPGTAVGVAVGGAAGAVLTKASSTDYDTTWTLSSITGDANSIIKRDANGRAQVANAAAATDIMNKQSVTTDIATHAALTTTHGVTGNIVGETSTQTLTNKTLTAPKASLVDVAQTDSPGNPAAGYNRLSISSAGLVTLRNNSGTIRQVPIQWPNTSTTFPTAGMVSGDTCWHTAWGLHVYTGAGWSQATPHLAITAAQRLTFVTTGLVNGFRVYEYDTFRNYTWTFSQWQYMGGGAAPSIDLRAQPTWNAANFENYDATFAGAIAWKDSASTVHLSGLVRIIPNVSVNGVLPCVTLPAGYRPASQVGGAEKSYLFQTAVNNAFPIRWDVTSAGNIKLVAGPNAVAAQSFAPLDGIAFVATG